MVTATSIIQRAAITLSDLGAIRWTTPELVLWTNDGQRETTIYRPDATQRTELVTLVPGARQELSAIGLSRPALKLIEITGGPLGAVRLTQRRILDAQYPTWQQSPGSIRVVEYMFDPREPKRFWVYPPALNTAQLDVVYSAEPIDVVVPAPGSLFSAVVGNIGVADIYANALLDYVLYRAFSKDEEYGSNSPSAAAHYSAFAAAMGIEVKATVMVQPGTKSFTGEAS